MIRSLLIAVLFGVLATSPARADVVMSPPTDCPAGTTPTTSHSGPHCAFAMPCSATSCGAGTSCIETGFCVREVECGGLPAPDERPCTEQHVIGHCDADGHCGEADLTCVRHPACAAPPPPPPPATAPPPPPATTTTESSGGGCHVGTRAPSELRWVPALVLLAAFARRRLRAH